MVKSTGVGRGRRTDLARASKPKVEYVARAICKAKGYDPDEIEADFDRNAAASVTYGGEYEGWEDDVFPKTMAWENYITEATAAINAIDNYTRKR